MTQSKKIIAITGGIGSGKSTVSAILCGWGYYVLSCDEVYAELLKDKNFVHRIEDKFGKVSDENGVLNREILSQIVFADSGARKTLENITHPVIMDEMLTRAKASEDNIVFCEVPLLFENGFEKLFDNVIVVMRDEKDRIEAVKKRSGLTQEQVHARIATQYDYSKVPDKNYIIINNNGNIEDLQCTMRDIIALF